MQHADSAVRWPEAERSVGLFFVSSRRRHTRFDCDCSSDVCSSDLRRRVGRLGLRAIGRADHPAGLPVAPDSCLRARALASEGFLMLEPEQTTFILLSFEGPDEYSQAGGLGGRVKELSRALAERGFGTHLFFVGDPKLPADESALDGRLWLHRWRQWISRYYPVGVYAGEDDKVADLNRSLPDSLVKDYIRPAIERGKTVVVLGEEWHLAHP